MTFVVLKSNRMEMKEENLNRLVTLLLMKTIRWAAVKSVIGVIFLVYVLVTISPVCFVLPANFVDLHYRAERWKY